MNRVSLHKLVEQCESGVVHCTQAVSEESGLFNEVMGDVKKIVSKATCFFLDEDSIGQTDEFSNDFVRLPFPICWFEGIDSTGRRQGLLCRELGEKTEVFVFMFRSHQWGFCQYIEFQNHESGALDVGVFPNDQFHLDFANMTMRWVRQFLFAMNCSENIKKVCIPADEKLNKSRAKKGKKPMFETWVLEIDLKKSEALGIGWGGAHASPRVHLRRGHMRQFSPGKFCWVPACVVGDKSLGLIQKDYAVH